MKPLYVVLCADTEAHGIEWADGPWDAEECVSACDEETAAARLCEAIDRLSAEGRDNCGPHCVARYAPVPEP